MTKPAIIKRARDIKPDTLYMVKHAGVCRFLCTEEIGWLRGHLLLEYNWRGAEAKAIDVLNDRVVSLDMVRNGDDWVFHPTVEQRIAVFDPVYFEQEIAEHQQEIDRHQSVIDRLLRIKARYYS